MISVKSKTDNRIEVSRSTAGSFDCFFSPGYSEITAYNLGVLAQEAYSEPNDTVEYLVNKVMRGARSKTTDYVFRNASREIPITKVIPFSHVGKISFVDTQGFTFEDPENTYIAFRGTQEIRDWLTDLDGKSVRSSFCHGNVHGGFHNALNAVLPQLKKILDARDKSKNVVLCGHSLGGALATLCAAWVRENYTDKVMLYTYGSPRAGCRDFVEHYTKVKPFPAFRVANPTDLVPSVPWDTASRDARRAESAPLVVLSPLGWIIVARNEIRESPEYMRYKHLGTPVSLQASGFSIVGNPAHLDGEFRAGVQKDWETMPLVDFIKSRSNNISHHFMAEYLPRLRKDFLDDCRNWAHGDPKPLQAKLASVESQLEDVEAQLRQAREELWKAPLRPERDALDLKLPHPPLLQPEKEVSPEVRVRELEGHRSHLRVQESLLKTQIADASPEGRKRSLQRISKRPFDGYLEEELLKHAG